MLHPLVQQFKDKVESSSPAIQWMYENTDWEKFPVSSLLPRETFWNVNAQEYQPIEYKQIGM